MSVRRETFVHNIGKGMTQTAAYMDAYQITNEDYARKAASKLMTKGDIVDAVAKLGNKAAKRAEVDTGMVLAEWAKVGFANMLDYVTIDKSGHATIDLSRVTRETAAAISEIATGHDASGRRYTKIKLYPKDPALEKIAKTLGMLNDNGAQININFGFAGQAGLDVVPETELEMLIAARLRVKP